MIKRIAKRLLITAAKGRGMQSVLSRTTGFLQFLQGIGSGSEVDTSGEKVVFSLLLERTPRGGTIFDVGANQGQFLDAALSAVGNRDFAIHSFEPAAETFRRLAARHGQTAGVRLHNLAVGRSRGSGTLWYDSVGSGIASLTRRDLAHVGVDFAASETVPITTIDDHAAEQGLSRIDLLKLDIEGHELDALVGAERMFAQQAIGMVLFEFGGCNIDTRTFFRDFWKFFENVGMRIHRITPAGTLVAIYAYDECFEQFRTTNFLAMTTHGR